MTCPGCGAIAFFEALTCTGCGAALGFHPASSTMLAVTTDATTRGSTEHRGATWLTCSQRPWGCNWLLREDEDTSRCEACRLIRRRPESDDTIAWEKLADAAVDNRRLVLQLHQLGLPVTGWYEQDGGLGFDLLSSRSANSPVMIGHANGIITVDLAESLDDYRESLRVRLGEPYRTMLGHFRHEVGHYYEWILVESAEDGALLEECRALFGDERASYTEALDRHYTYGAPRDWRERFISEYATMHPWEDFAECFAHFLHIQSTLSTAASGGLVLRAERLPGLLSEDLRFDDDYADRPVERILDDWRGLATFFNRVNRAMGHDDVYPFEIPEPVVRKLAFVHRVVTRNRELYASPTGH